MIVVEIKGSKTGEPDQCLPLSQATSLSTTSSHGITSSPHAGSWTRAHGTTSPREGCSWHSACWQGCAECAAVGKSPSWALGHCEPLLFWSMPVLMADTSRMGAPSQCGGAGLWTLSPRPRAFPDIFLILPLFSGADQPILCPQGSCWATVHI